MRSVRLIDRGNSLCLESEHNLFGLSHVGRKFYQRVPKAPDPVRGKRASPVRSRNENYTTNFRPVPKNKQALNESLGLRADRNLFRWFAEIGFPEHQIRVGYHETRN